MLICGGPRICVKQHLLCLSPGFSWLRVNLRSDFMKSAACVSYHLLYHVLIFASWFGWTSTTVYKMEVLVCGHVLNGKCCVKSVKTNSLTSVTSITTATCKIQTLISSLHRIRNHSSAFKGMRGHLYTHSCIWGNFPNVSVGYGMHLCIN